MHRNDLHSEGLRDVSVHVTWCVVPAPYWDATPNYKVEIRENYPIFPIRENWCRENKITILVQKISSRLKLNINL